MREALCEAADAPGYPFTAGTGALREAVASFLARRFGAKVDPSQVLPTIGTKEFVALVPTLLGLGAGDTVAVPRVAYPTYAVGALLANCTVVEADSVGDLAAAAPTLIWLNSPANPTGQILGPDHLAGIVSWARDHGALVISDECYAELAWDRPAVSILHPSVSGGSAEGILALHSLSKRSNLAGYRFGFAAGDPQAISLLLEVRKHAGLIVPAPVQAAAIAALADDAHVEDQRVRYRRRRDALRPALESAGFRIDFSDGGLYLWASRDEPCWTTVEWLATLGILVAPGDFYGAAGNGHVRVALTATDERIDAAVSRLYAASTPG